MSHVNDGRGGVPASAAERAEQLRKMKESSRRQDEELATKMERSRLSEIEYRKRWDAYFESLGLDDIIEIPGRQGGEDIVLRCRVGKGGRLIEVKESD